MARSLEGLNTRPVTRNLEGLNVKSTGVKKESPSILNYVTEAGKSALKGVGSALDLPSAIASGLSGIANNMGRRDIEMYQRMNPNLPQIDYQDTDLGSYVPTTEDARSGLKNYTGIDLEPNPTTPFQRMLDTTAQTAGAFTPFGAAGKAAGLGKMFKLGKTGTGIGATSGVLQEGGVDPLYADLGSAFLAPTAATGISKGVKGTGNLLNRFTKAGQEKAISSATSDILKDKVGEKNIKKVLKNLNTTTPFNTNLTTAELAQNTGISSLDRALAPSVPAIAEKKAIADMIMQKELSQLSPKMGIEPYNQGEAIRNYLAKELETKKLTRSNVTKPLYDEVNKIRQGVDLPNTQDFLSRESEFAKGDIKKTLNYIENLITSNKLSKSEAKSFEKLLPKNLGDNAISQLKKEIYTKPVPAELTNALKDISGRIGVAKRSGNNEVARVLQEAKSNILVDMAQIPEEALARSTYEKLSKPVSAIEKEPLLAKFVKKDPFNKEFLTSPEKIPDMILRGSVNNTKALMSQVGNDKKTVEMIRGSIVDKLLSTSQLASINSLEQPNISYNKVNNFLKKNKEKLPLIFDKNQMQVLNDVNSILKRRAMAESVGRGVGSNTQSQLTLLDNLTDPVKKSIGKKLIDQIPGGKYFTPLFEMSKKYEKEQITRLLEKALLEPDVAKLLLTPAKSIKNDATLKSVLMQVGIPASSYSLTKEIQREE